MVVLGVREVPWCTCPTTNGRFLHSFSSFFTMFEVVCESAYTAEQTLRGYFCVSLKDDSYRSATDAICSASAFIFDSCLFFVS